MNEVQKHRVERIVLRAKELIAENRKRMVESGRIEDEILMTEREHAMDEWLRGKGYDVDGKLVRNDGPMGFIAVLKP